MLEMAKTSTMATFAIVVLAALAGFGRQYGWLFPKVLPEPVCDTNWKYNTQFLSVEPLMMHIQNFISPSESEYLAGISRRNFTHRLFVDESDVKRKSAPPLAILSLQDPIVECIQQRATSFLGSIGEPEFELLSLSRYNVSHQVQPHLDASIHPMVDSETGRKFNRRTSFFVYIQASSDLEGGETYFPRIPFPGAIGSLNPAVTMKRNASGVPALAIKPVSGSAIFWLGLKADGTPYYETWHEGLPVLNGVKTGMNIWAKHYID